MLVIGVMLIWLQLPWYALIRSKNVTRCLRAQLFELQREFQRNTLPIIIKTPTDIMQLSFDIYSLSFYYKRYADLEGGIVSC